MKNVRFLIVAMRTPRLDPEGVLRSSGVPDGKAMVSAMGSQTAQNPDSLKNDTWFFCEDGFSSIGP